MCIYHQYLSQLLNFMKSPERCTVLYVFLYPHTCHRMEVYHGTQNNICRKQTSCAAGFLRVQQAEGLALKADPGVNSMDPPKTTAVHHCHTRFIWPHIMLMSPPKPQCSEIRAAAAKSLQRRWGKLNKIHLLL